MVDGAKPRDWRPWAKWIVVVLVTALVARYTGREAVAPPPPDVLPPGAAK